MVAQDTPVLEASNGVLAPGSTSTMATPSSVTQDRSSAKDRRDELGNSAVRTVLPAIRRALSSPDWGWQDTLSESTGLSAHEASFLTWRTPTPDPVALARRSVGMAPCPTLDETGVRQTTPDRAQMRTNMAHKYDLVSSLRDTS